MIKQVQCRKDWGGCGRKFKYICKKGIERIKKFCPECIKKRRRINEKRVADRIASIKNEDMKKIPRMPCIGVLCRGDKDFQPRSRFNRICRKCRLHTQGYGEI